MMNVLIITNKKDITSDFVVRELTNQGIPFYRLNTEEIGNSIHLSLDFQRNNYLLLDTLINETVHLSSFTSVYFRRPEININVADVTRDELQFLHTELHFILEGMYKILSDAFWLNHVDKIRLAENKIYQLLVAMEIGFKIPSSLITDQQDTALEFYSENNHSCIAKPIRSGLIGTDGNESFVFTSKIVLDEHNSARVGAFPIYLQQLIPKKYDLRVNVVGNKLFTAMIDSQRHDDSKVDWRHSAIALDHQLYNLPTDIADKCIALTKKLGLNFGAIDLVLDQQDQFFFLEINPNGQWAWIENRLGVPISKEITKLLIGQPNKAN
jgi:glutathione synthase/RimK-type ligase-like ATP-grasp enzyme